MVPYIYIYIYCFWIRNSACFTCESLPVCQECLSSAICCEETDLGKVVWEEKRWENKEFKPNKSRGLRAGIHFLFSYLMAQLCESKTAGQTCLDKHTIMP